MSIWKGVDMQIDSTHRCILTIWDGFHSRMSFDNCQEFSFLQEIEAFYPFHQFCHNRFQHSTHTHNSLRPAQKYLTKKRNWDTQSFTVYWVNKRKEGEKKSSCRSFLYADKTCIYKFLTLTGKETTFPEIPSGLMQGSTLEHEMHLSISRSLWYKIIGKIKMCIIEYIQLHICAWEVRIWVQVESGWQIHLNWIGESLGDTSCI
jgi:hypothetical protein